MTCPAGEIALAGGWEITLDDDNNSDKIYIKSSKPESSGGGGTLAGDRWSVTFTIAASLGGGNPGNQIHVTAVVLCSL